MQVQDRTDGRRIDVHDATIRTATVEVKTLTISGKQVTLAVFRQLPDADLIEFDRELPVLTGLPWGRVNYHADGCKDWPDHFHVVWQMGDELQRAVVYRKPPKAEMEEWSSAFGLAARMLVHSRMRATGEPFDQAAAGLGFDHRNVWEDGKWHPALVGRVAGVGFSEYTTASDLQPPKAAESFLADEQARLDEQVRAYESWRAAYDRLATELSQLNQLFIAV